MSCFAGVAQLRAPPCQGGCRGFESFARSNFLVVGKQVEILSSSSGTQAERSVASFLPKSTILAPAPFMMGIIGKMQGLRSGQT